MGTKPTPTSLNKGQVDKIVQILGGHEQALKLIDGKLTLSEILKKAQPPNTIIRVDRSVRSSDFENLLHPELETVGPAEYNLTDIKLWISDGCSSGNRIYYELKRNNTLKTCLGIHDALEIQKKGVAVFRKFFGEKFERKRVFFWKSVGLYDKSLFRKGTLYVPYLFDDGVSVVLLWQGVGSIDNFGGFIKSDPAARFEKI